MKSIIQSDDEKKCFICGTNKNLECHHIFGGANRQLSEKYGLKVWLCRADHTGPFGVHKQPEIMENLRQLGQAIFETVYDEDFERIFGRSYLDV